MQEELFHIHTYRCGHASNEQDYEYVEKAIDLGAKRITFTDHAPFPGNPFGSRMDIQQLPEYINSLSELRREYQKYIDIVIGLEIEYLPSYYQYYLKLHQMEQLQLMMLGQHFYEHEPGYYSLSDSDELLQIEEAIGVSKAIVQGICSNLFTVVAHPDRMFRRRLAWSPDLQEVSTQIIGAALNHNVILEQNESSKAHQGQYWNEFWELAKQMSAAQSDANCKLRIIRGLDAHETEQLRLLK